MRSQHEYHLLSEMIEQSVQRALLCRYHYPFDVEDGERHTPQL